MKEMTLIEKLSVLFENILNHPLFIIVFFIPIILFLLRKQGKKVYVILYFIIVIIILLLGGDNIFKLFDNLMDGIFMTLYFPNFITLFIVVILSAIFALMSLISKNIRKIYKVINYINFGLTESLFALVLVIVNTNKINIYKSDALYSNNDLLAIMQILIGTFTLCTLSIVIIYLIGKVTSILDKKENKSIDSQIENLKETKIKTVNIDNDKIGYINVADKRVTSIPILKPFKFNIEKLESIKLDVVPKKIREITVGDKTVSYLNEIPQKIKLVDIDHNKIVKVEMIEQLFKNKESKSQIKNIKLDEEKPVNLSVESKPINILNIKLDKVSYLNEVTKPKKFKISKINSEKLVRLNVKDKPYSFINVNEKYFTYLNEIEKNKKIRNITLKDSCVSYLDEVIKPRKFKIIKLETGKINHIQFEKEKNHFISKNIINAEVSDNNQNQKQNLVIHDGLIKGTSKDNDFDKLFTSKPELVESKSTENKENLINNLRIIDIQSTLDVIANCRLMKNAKIESYDAELSVDNLEICNMELLIDVMKQYKLSKSSFSL